MVVNKHAHTAAVCQDTDAVLGGVCALESSSLTSTVQISRKVNIARV